MLSLFLPFLTVFLLVFIYLEYFSAYFKGENELEGEEVYIDKFPVNMSFEITPYNNWVKYNSLFSAEQRQIIDNYEFDLDVYISSDYRCVARAIKQSPEVQKIIYDIITDKIIKSIEFNHNKIKILFKDEYLTPTNRELTSDHAKFLYDKKIKILQEKFLPLLKNAYNKELKEDIKFAKEKTKKLKTLHYFYISFFSAFFTQIISNTIIQNYYLLINNISILLTIFLSILIFIPFSFYIWNAMSGSARIHKLFSPHLMLLCALPFFIYSFIYTANYSLDISEPYNITTKHNVYIVAGKKNFSFYYKPYDLENIYVSPDFRINIRHAQYVRFLNNKKSQVTIKNGALGYPYVTNIKPIEEEKE